MNFGNKIKIFADKNAIKMKFAKFLNENHLTISLYKSDDIVKGNQRVKFVIKYRCLESGKDIDLFETEFVGKEFEIKDDDLIKY